MPFHRRRGLKRARPERMQLCTTDFRPQFVARAVFAGFFPFASEIEHFPGRCLEDRCLLNLELGGKGRTPTASGDSGGRIVLAPNEETQGTALLPLRVGKKTLRALRRDCGNDGPSSWTLRCHTHDSMTAVLDRLVRAHGVDWIGFRRVQALLSGAAPSGWDGGLPVRVVAIELHRHHHRNNHNNHSNSSATTTTTTMVSGEIGLLCGSCYTCLSLFADADSGDNGADGGSRCGRIRAYGAVLLLAEAGVGLFDVGTTAGYFSQFGFRRTTRREFVQLWRQWRSVPLAAAASSSSSSCGGGGSGSSSSNSSASAERYSFLADGAGGGGEATWTGEDLVRHMEAQRAAMAAACLTN